MHIKSRTKKEEHIPFDEENIPNVTIQLPIYNEMFVAERLIRKVTELDYPKDKLEIQVLED